MNSGDAINPICAPIWFSTDNSKIYTGCGGVYSSAAAATQDMLYLGTLGSLSSIQSLASSSSLNQIVAIPLASTFNNTPMADTQVDLFDSAYYNPLGAFQTNPFTVGFLLTRPMAAMFSILVFQQNVRGDAGRCRRRP